MNILIFIVVVLGATLTIGITFELFSAFRDRRRYRQAPGERVSIGASELHFVRKGERQVDQPAVVLEAGIGGNWLDWELVIPEIANFAQVIAYDRAGYGWSDRSKAERTPEIIVAELHTLLQNAKIEPPYLLVGHSFGGLYVRLFAATYPDEVAGLILVDASHPMMIDQQDTKAELRRLRNVRIVKRIGMLRLMMRRMLYRADHLYGDSKKRYTAFNLLDSGNVVHEAKPIFQNGFDLPETIEVPLTIISRDADENVSAEAKWMEYQELLVALSPEAEHYIADTSGHYIALSDPEVVVEVIAEMLGITLDEVVDEETQSA